MNFRDLNYPRIVILALAAMLIGVFSAQAQVRPIYDRGAMGLVQTLKRLGTSASVLMVGAHPDDEDTALLAYLARGENARTAYLSLTRGDGGQNIIGPELGEALGLIRTEELLQARTLDGAEQYFTRAYDYGFSKTLAEAKEKWDEKVILCDAVRVIRNFRPIVVVSQFSGMPTDGHGHHQFAGYITPIAVKAAADPAQCKDAGNVWAVSRLLIRHGFRAGGEPKIRINTGRFDPVLGRSYFEIAMEARSQHKSQEQGVLELRGPQFSGLNPAGNDPIVESIFSDLDLRATGAAKVYGITDPADNAALQVIQRSADSALEGLNVLSPEGIIPHLIRGYQAATDAELRTRASGPKAFFGEKRRGFAEAIALAAGVRIDALAERETVVPGETILIGAKAFTAKSGVVNFKKLEIRTPQSWKVAEADAPPGNNPAAIARESADFTAFYRVTVPAQWQATRPYWLADPRDGDIFRWDNAGRAVTLPFQDQPMTLSAELEVMGTSITIERPVEFRFADDVRGEIRRNVDIVPAVSVELDRSMLIIPQSERERTVKLAMTITNHSSSRSTGVASLNINAPVEWRYSAETKSFDLARQGEKAVITFEVSIPAGTRPGNYSMSGNAMIGETLATDSMITIAYPHIQTRRYYRRAEVETKILDLKTAPVKIGYLVGSGDRVPDAIRQMGFDLEMISEGELATGNLSRFDTIVVGIRAYQVRPDIVANNGRLLDYIREGGTLIVQYQLPGYAQQRLMPFPTQMGPRVSDENAPITIIEPAHRIFNYPNKITQKDFSGWVQERNLYNFTNFGPEYTGLLEAHDPGEAENRGGLVIAPLGKGTYIYTGYSFFRQLPAGVEGAYRLFANMLSNSAKDPIR